MRIVTAEAVQKRWLLDSVDERGRACCSARIVRRHSVVGDRHGLSLSEDSIELLFGARSFCRRLEGDDGDAGGAPAAIVL